MTKAKKNEVYICWVHPDVRKKEPGVCEKCPLFLVPEAIERELGAVLPSSRSRQTVAKH